MMKVFRKLLAIILSVMLILSVLPMWVAADEYGVIVLDTPFSVTYEGEMVFYTFTPNTTGIYRIASVSEDLDTKVSVYKDITSDPIFEADDSEESYDFNQVIMLYSNVTYYFGFMILGECGTYDVTLSFKSETVENIISGETKNVNIANGGDEIIYKFVPESDGYYTLYSEGDYDTYCTLYDENLVKIEIDDDGSEYNNNFKLSYKLTAGTTYYYGVKFYYSDVIGEFSVTLEITQLPEELYVDAEDETTAYVGQLFTVDYSVYPSDAVSDIAVTLSDEKVAELVDVYEGKIELLCLNEGSTEVTVSTVNGIQKTFKLNVSEVPAVALECGKTVSMSESTYNGTYHFTFVPDESGYYVYATLGDVSHNLEIYDSNGVYIGGGNGIIARNLVWFDAGEEYHLRIRTEDYSSDWQIVIAEDTEPESIKINREDFNVYVEDSGYLEAITEPFYAASQTVEWISSDAEVFEINDDGYYKANKAGTVTVTAKMEDLSHSITITVSEGDSLPLNNAESFSLVDGEDRKKFKIIPEKDGKYRFRITSDQPLWVMLYDLREDLYIEEVVTSEDPDLVFDCNLYQGETYYFTMFNQDDVASNVTVEMTEAPTIVKAEISKMPYKTEYFKGTLENYFNTIGAELKLTFSNGDVVYTKLADWEYDYEYEYTESGDNGTVEVTVENVSATIDVKLVESDIESIAVDPDFSLLLMENVDGFMLYDQNGETFFYYDYHLPEDLPIMVKFKDGSERELTVSDSINNEFFYLDDNQYDEHWVKGGNYVTTLKIMDVYLDVPVIIEENTITSIELTSLPDKTEYVYGDINYGLYTGYDYLVIPELDGIEFTINYSDRESEVITYSEDTSTVGGYYIDLPQCYPTAPGKETVEFEFLGEQFAFDLTFTESNVIDIEVVKLPDKTEYFEYAESFNPVGMEIKITFADGTNETVKVEEDMLSFMSYYWEEGIKIENGDNDLLIHAPYYTDEVYIICNGVCITFDGVTAVESGVEEIRVLDLGNKGNGMAIELVFADGSTDVITVNPIYSMEWPGFVTGYAITDYGILNYYVDEIYDTNGNVLISEVEILDFVVYVVNSKGDCNGDGDVNTADLALLKLFLANVGSVDESGADLNSDGKVDTVDLAKLKLVLAGI